MRWTLDEIASVTGGRVVNGRPAVRAEGVSTDTRALRAGQAFFALRGERFDGHAFLAEAAAKGASCAVVEESRLTGPAARTNGLALVAVRDTVQALGLLAANTRAASRIPWVAVTGSAGKTTTKELIAAALSPVGPVLKARASFNNHVGVPLTVLGLREDHRAAVVELGMNAPGEIAPLAAVARPTVAVVTSIGPAHLERFGTVEGIAREKAEALRALAPDGVAVLPAGCEHIGILREAAPATIVTFGFAPGAHVRAEGVRVRGDGGASFRVDGMTLGLRLPGRANVSNALAALAVADVLGVPRAEAAGRIAEVEPVRMRGRIRGAGGVLVYDDCYNANPLSFGAALCAWRALPAARRWVVAGNMRELGSASAALHEELGRSIAHAGAELLVTVGEFGAETARGAANAGMPRETITVVETAQQAAAYAGLVAREGDLVLVKGSRAMGLERVVEALIQPVPAPAAAAGRR